MAPVAIVFGVALSALGGWLYYITDMVSPTALIPAFFGLPLIVCGLIAFSDGLRKHAMHVAVLIGLFGFAVPLWRVIKSALGENFAFNNAILGQITMSALCFVFVALCVKSFIDARIASKAKEAAARS
ncbi:MAG: hypothetical protein EXS16_21665 [Gemmataceae bacterium]|nr:hypothetical protein [Gemmataceae bacterium]